MRRAWGTCPQIKKARFAPSHSCQDEAQSRYALLAQRVRLAMSVQVSRPHLAAAGMASLSRVGGRIIAGHHHVMSEI
jgi:hypothetical protein